LSQATHTQPIGFRTISVALVILALAVVLYFPVIKALVDQWWDDSNYRHGFLVPMISGFLIYRRWDELKSAKPGGGTTLGVALIVLSGIFLVGGTAAAELMTSRLSLPTFLIGTSLVFLGRDFTRRAAFPLLFLYMMIPLPYIIYYKIAFPLQLLSAKLAAGILDLLGVSIIRQGNVLHLPDYVLEVVAACSGLRSLMTMVTLALVMGAVGEMSTPKRWVLVMFAVPAAIAANTLRLVVTGFGAYTVSSSFADGFLHDLSGMVVFVTGLAVLLSVYAILRRMQ
jgi:exosortase